MLPHNALTKRPYEGNNEQRLLDVMVQFDFESDGFVTFHQARELGRPVPKGCKSCARIVRLAKPKASKGKKRTRKLVPLEYAVWNLDQLPEPEESK